MVYEEGSKHKVTTKGVAALQAEKANLAGESKMESIVKADAERNWVQVVALGSHP